MTAGRNSASSLSHDWCTPPKYVDAIRRFFGGSVGLDPCSNRHSIVGAIVEYALPDNDGLTARWDYPTVFVNPPYGKDPRSGTTIRDWLRRCRDAHQQHDAEVIALVPVATNTRHWKEYVFGAATAVSFLYDTRLRFLVDGESSGTGAPMSCAMIYWGRDYEHFEDVFIEYGAIVDVRHLHGRAVGMGKQYALIAANGRDTGTERTVVLEKRSPRTPRPGQGDGWPDPTKP